MNRVSKINSFLKGQRCQYSKDWFVHTRWAHNPKDHGKRGTVLGLTRDGLAIRVRWDGQKEPHVYHFSFIEPIYEGDYSPPTT